MKYVTEYILNLNPYGQHLFIFVLDIHYPKKLHNRDFEFPFLCDQSIPKNDNTKKNVDILWQEKLHFTTSHVKILFRKRIKI